jgi:hypothetical protein
MKVKNNTEILKLLKDLYENVFTDNYNIYTPLELCEEMINSLTALGGDILVISNLEFLIILKNKINLDNVHYTTSCDIKKQVAISLGINLNNIIDLQYNNKEINLGIQEMKFDVVIQNPPYNPNSLWKKFVEKGIDLLNDNGQMVTIHPDSWRTSSKHNKLCNYLKEHISELHITGLSSFPGVNISTDWYLYNKQKINLTKIVYNDGNIENLKLNNNITPFSINSIPGKILNKITKQNYNNGIICLKGWDELNPLFKQIIPSNILKYKQCGGKENGNGWTKDIFTYTEKPTKDQFTDKVVMAYVGYPRARFFSKDEQVGVITGFYWNTTNKSLPILLNSKMYLKLFFEITNYDKRMFNIPMQFLRSLKFDDLNVQTEEELYEHYNLTEEEINFIEQ